MRFILSGYKKNLHGTCTKPAFVDKLRHVLDAKAVHDTIYWMSKRLALYRKYRPTTFSQLIGQEHIVRTLTNALQLNRVGHAYLFVGPRGTGKTTTARLLAKALNCTNRTKSGDPCGTCPSCKAFGEGRHPDLVEIDAATYTGVDHMRQLREGVRVAPIMSDYKTYVIDEAHMLSKGAVNALLKTLEEPPAHAVFVLATTEIEKIPATVLSRAQRFDFRTLTVSEIAGRLSMIAKKEGAQIDKDAIDLLATAADGSVRDGETLLEQALAFIGESATREEIMGLLGIPDPLIVRDLARAMLARDASTSLEILDNAMQKGADAETLSRRLISYLRDTLLVHIDPKLADTVERQAGRAQREGVIEDAARSERQQLLSLLPQVMEAGERVRFSPIPQLPLELVIAGLSDNEE